MGTPQQHAQILPQEFTMRQILFHSLVSLLLLAPTAVAAPPEVSPAGVVCHIQVLSDKVPDVSSLDAWKKSFLRDGMTDQEKALAVWRSTVMFQHQDAPPCEYLTH